MERVGWKVVYAALAILVGMNVAIASEEVPRMSKEDLRLMLEHPDLVILDARVGGDWEHSAFKIKGAHRTDPMAFDRWKDRFPKDNILVLYCT